MVIFVFFYFLAFWQFTWQRQPFWKNQPLKKQFHMAYDIPTRFHKVWSRHLREMYKLLTEERKNKNNNKKRSKHNMSPKLWLGDIITITCFITKWFYLNNFISYHAVTWHSVKFDIVWLKLVLTWFHFLFLTKSIKRITWILFLFDQWT
jgi:hypothetical protein